MGNRSPKAVKRRKILECATRLFTKLGYNKTSVEDIAQGAGIAKGTVYLSFSSKAEILRAVIAEEEEAYLEQIKPLLTDAMSEEERLRLWVRNVVLMPSTMPLTSQLMAGDRELMLALEDLPEEVSSRGQDLLMEFTTQLLEALPGSEALSAAQLSARATAIGALTHFWGAVEKSPLGKQLSRGRCAQVLAELMVDGVPGAESDDGDGADRPAQG